MIFNKFILTKIWYILAHIILLHYWIITGYGSLITLRLSYKILLFLNCKALSFWLSHFCYNMLLMWFFYIIACSSWLNAVLNNYILILWFLNCETFSCRLFNFLTLDKIAIILKINKLTTKTCYYSITFYLMINYPAFYNLIKITGI